MPDIESSDFPLDYYRPLAENRLLWSIRSHSKYVPGHWLDKVPLLVHEHYNFLSLFISRNGLWWLRGLDGMSFLRGCP